MNTLKTSPEVIDRTGEFVQYLRGGKRLAISAKDYVSTRGLWGVKNDITGMVVPEEAKDAATMLLAMPNTINSIKQSGKIDPSIFLVLHEALANLMTNADNVQLTRTQLVQYCIRYCKETALITNGQEAMLLEDQLLADINGVWHELNWENALLCSGVIAEHSSRSEDLNGIDIWIDMGEGLDLGVDVKTTKEGARRHATKNNIDIAQEYSFTSNNRVEGSFEITLMADSTGKKIYLVMENPPYSNNIAPVDFRTKHAETATVKLLLEKLYELGPEGDNALRLHRRIENGKSVFHKPYKRNGQ